MSDGIEDWEIHLGLGEPGEINATTGIVNEKWWLVRACWEVLILYNLAAMTKPEVGAWNTAALNKTSRSGLPSSKYLKFCHSSQGLGEKY